MKKGDGAAHPHKFSKVGACGNVDVMTVNDVRFDVINILQVGLLAVRCHLTTLSRLFANLCFRPQVLIV